MLESLIYLALVLQLGSPSYAAREVAQQKLAGHLDHAIPVVTWGCTSKDAEVATRCAKLRERWANEMSCKIKPDAYPFLPWIDSLPPGETRASWHDTVEEYLARAGHEPILADANGEYGAINLHFQPPWLGYRDATRLLIAKMLLDGKTVAEVKAMLNGMAEYEITWIREHGNNYHTFPPELRAACGLAPKKQ